MGFIMVLIILGVLINLIKILVSAIKILSLKDLLYQIGLGIVVIVGLRVIGILM